jgi:hypothetical protein
VHRYQEVSSVRNYAPIDDGLEPADFDEYYDYPAATARDLAVRVYVSIERDPERAAELLEKQNTAIMELLQWARDNQDEPLADAHERPVKDHGGQH